MFYKYYSAAGRGKENLEKNTICFSDIDKFNDPFEGIGKYLYDVSPEEQAYWDSIGSDLPKSLSERFSEESRNALKFKQRVWCVTETYTNELMWAHYADSHKGFCVGYTEESIRKVCNKFEKVLYCENPTAIDIRGDIGMDAIERLLFQKDTSWIYENEWRALYTLQRTDVEYLDYRDNLEKCFSDNSEFLYTPYGHINFGNLAVLRSRRCIIKECPPSEVYLGLRTSQEDRTSIVQICKDQKIPVFQMIQVPGSFELSSVPIFEPK